MKKVTFSFPNEGNARLFMEVLTGLSLPHTVEFNEYENAPRYVKDEYRSWAIGQEVKDVVPDWRAAWIVTIPEGTPFDRPTEERFRYAAFQCGCYVI